MQPLAVRGHLELLALLVGDHVVRLELTRAARPVADEKLGPAVTRHVGRLHRGVGEQGVRRLGKRECDVPAAIGHRLGAGADPYVPDLLPRAGPGERVEGPQRVAARHHHDLALAAGGLDERPARLLGIDLAGVGARRCFELRPLRGHPVADLQAGRRGDRGRGRRCRRCPR